MTKLEVVGGVCCHWHRGSMCACQITDSWYHTDACAQHAAAAVNRQPACVRDSQLEAGGNRGNPTTPHQPPPTPTNLTDPNRCCDCSQHRANPLEPAPGAGPPSMRGFLSFILRKLGGPAPQGSSQWLTREHSSSNSSDTMLSSSRTFARSVASAVHGVVRTTPLRSSCAVAAANARRCNATDALRSMIDEQLDSMRADGKYKAERIITSPQQAEISVEGSDAPVLNFCANNYLGLAHNPDVEAAAVEAIKSRGFGLSSVRFICGTQDMHRDLEKVVADFHGMESAILYPSCFDANAGLFEALLDERDAVISDELNHASIIDGIRLCKAQRKRFKHMDMADLEAQLKAVESARTKLIVTDGVFSMDGDVAPLNEICDLAEKYAACGRVVCVGG